MKKRRIVPFNQPYQNARSWPTGPRDVAYEPEFSDRYIDVSAPGAPAPKGPQIARPGRQFREQTGGVVDTVPVGVEKARPVIRQARFVNLAATVGLTAQQLLASNQRRSYLIIQNTSASTIFVTFDRPASLSTGVQILSGGNYEPITPPVSSVWGIALTADLTVILIEGTT
ncbi:MAG: hypothetical protein GY807_23530 [Gammaproteobacteria bacterium]|nr:hypothetical protein [Gammaproteobacteria bacterium]